MNNKQLILDGSSVIIKITYNKDKSYYFYNFEWENILCAFVYDTSVQEDIVLDIFNKSKNNKKNGYKLLCFALQWIKENKDLNKVKTVSLASVPHKIDGKRDQERLNSYYRRIGFIDNKTDHDFLQDIDTLVIQCKTKKTRGVIHK
jgi:hypothetical protein